MSDQGSYRVWNAATGKWARTVAQVDDKMYIQEETDDIHLAATWERDTAMSIVLDGLDRGQRLHEFAFDAVVPAAAPGAAKAPFPGALRPARHEDESPIPLTPAQKAAWAKLEEHSGYISSLIYSASNRELAERRLDRRIAAQAEELTRLQRRVMDLEASAGGAAGRMAERIESHEVCLDGHRKSLCAIIERLDRLGKAPGKVADVPDPRMQSPRDMCRKYSIQACHYCERLACGDNTSPGGALYRAAKVAMREPAGVFHSVCPELAEAVKAIDEIG